MDGTRDVERLRRWGRTFGHDRDAQFELTSRSVALPKGLELEWLGTAGYRIAFEGQCLLIDPYLTRASLADLLRRRPMLPDPAAVDRFLPDIGEVVGIVVGHTHFDHAVDTPALAGHFNCPALGSSSLARLMALHHLSPQAVVVEPHRRYELGPFTVSFVPSVHSKLVFGLAVPMAGELTCDHLDRLSGQAYRCGQVWGIHISVGGVTIYHQGSADFIEDELRVGPVDIFLAGIAGRAYTPDYLPRIVRKLQPTTIIPSHYDNFFRPLGAPMEFSFNVNLAAFVDEATRTSRGIQLVGLEPVPGVGFEPTRPR